jgi:hypothetical protein
MKMSPDTARSQRDRKTVAAAVKFVVATVAVAGIVLVAVVAWVSSCKAGSGTGALANCTALQRNTFAFGPAAVLLAGGVAAFVRTYQVWKARGGWWIWQGAGWFLLVLMLVVYTTTTPIALL